MKIFNVPIDLSLEEICESLQEKKATYLDHKILYYPYWVSEAKVNAKVLTRAFTDCMCCWIDLVTGREALSSPILSLEENNVEEKNIIKVQLEEDNIERKVKSYITFALLNKIKLLKAPKIEILDQRLIYRPYYVVSHIEKDETKTMMIDGVSGEHYSLSL